MRSPEGLSTSMSPVINLMLKCNQPVCIWLGSELIQYYNEAYSVLLEATGQPKEIAQPTINNWGPSWENMKRIITTVINTGETTEVKNQLVLIKRSEYLEETYFNYVYSPLKDEKGEIAGIYCSCTEVTEQVVSQRRLATIQKVTLEASTAKTVKQACSIGFEDNDRDIPFALVYLLGEDEKIAYLVKKIGFKEDHPNLTRAIELGTEKDRWNFKQLKENQQPTLFNGIKEKNWPSGFWHEITDKAFAIPLSSVSNNSHLIGFLVMGINPHRQFEQHYQDFFEILAKNLTSTLARIEKKVIKKTIENVAREKSFNKLFTENDLLAQVERVTAKSLNQASRQGRINLEKLLCNINEGVFSLDQQWRFTYVNHRQCEIMSVKEEDVLGKNIWECFPEARGTYVYKQFFKAMEQQTVLHFQYLFKPWNRWFENHIYPNENGLLVLCAEITQTKELEIAERFKKSKKMTLATQAEKIGTWEWNVINDTVIWSKEYYLIYGLDQKTTQPSYENWLKSICVEDQSRVNQATRQAVAEKKNIQLEFRINHPNGIRWLHTKGKIACDQSGSVMRMFGIVIDITEQKNAESLKENFFYSIANKHHTLESIFQKMPQGVIIADKASGKLLLANEQAQTLIGTPYRLSLKLDNYEKYIEFKGYHPDGTPYTNNDWPLARSLKQGETINHEEIKLRWEDGSEMWLDVNSSPILDNEGGIMAAITTFDDITLRKQTEKELFEEKERFELAAKAVNCLIYDWDLITNTIERTDALTSLFGYSQEEVEPTPQWWASLIHPDDLDKVTILAWAALCDSDHCVMEYRVLKQDNTYAYVLDHALIVRDATGRSLRIVGSTIDITERKRMEAERQQAEEFLRLSEERYRLLTSTLTSLVWTTDSQGAFITPQAPWGAYTGQSQEEYQGFGWLDKIHPNDQQPFMARWLDTLAQKTNYFSHGRIWHQASGEYHYCEIRGVPLLNADGSIREWVGNVIDIHERFQMELAIKDKEERLRLSVEGAALGIWDHDLLSDTFYFSPRASAMLGTHREIDHQSFRELLHPDDRLKFQESIANVIATGEPGEFEYRIIHPDGSLRWIAILRQAYYDESGQAIRTAGITQDITERKLAEEALRVSEQRFREMAETIEAVFWRADFKEQRLLYVSPAYKKIWGRSVESVYQNLGDWINTIHPEDREKVQQASVICIEHGKFQLEYRIIRPDGTVRWIHDRGFVLKESLPDACEVVGFAQDITDRKMAETALRETTAILNAIQESTSILIFVKDRQGRFLMANPATVKVIGKPVEQLLGYTHFEFMDNQELAEQIMANDRHVMESGEVLSCEEVVEFDGVQNIFLSIKFPYRDEQGDVIGLIGVSTNITERKQAESALIKSEAKFRRLVEANIFGVAIGDFAGNMLYANDSLLKMIGYTREELEAGEISWINLTPLEELTLDLQAVQELRAKGICKPFEKYYFHKDGHKVPILIGGALLDEPDQEAQTMITFYMDLSELKEAETALQQQRLLLETILKQAADGVVVTDATGKLTFVNQAARKIAGLDPEDTSVDFSLNSWGTAFDYQGNLIPTEEYALSQALNGTVCKATQARMVRDDGSYYDVLISAAPLINEDNQLVGAVATFMDISEHKEIEEALRRSEERFRATFEQAAVGVAHISLSGRWLRVNNRLCEITGYSRDELSNMTFQEITHPDDLESDLNNVGLLLTGQVQTFSMEKRYIRKDGSIVWVELTVSLVEESTQVDHSQYFISVVEDITERKEAALNLQKRNQELDQFAYIVSHDLKAPLRAISNLSEWIEEDLKDQIPPENQEQLQLMRDRVSRMENLINGLLEYSRVGRRQGAIEMVCVHSLLEEIIDSLCPPSGFEINIAPNLPSFKTHRVLLAQIFTNLISNAIKHHPNGNGNITINVARVEKFYEFSVADDGKGIAREHHNRIFALFHTLEKSENNDSTGIGLAIVKKIIESHGGNIKVESELGQGSTFRFTWPVAIS